MNPLDALLQELLTQGLRPLNVPVPPNLETALGYPGAARFIVFRWDWDKDELFAQDNATAQVANSLTWLSYIRHPRTAPALADFDDYGADHDLHDVFLLDRQTRQAYVGTAKAVLPLIAALPASALQEATPAAPTSDEIAASLGDWNAAPTPELQAIRTCLEAQHEQHDIMLAWLDALEG